jgi:hypothetical protein
MGSLSALSFSIEDLVGKAKSFSSFLFHDRIRVLTYKWGTAVMSLWYRYKNLFFVKRRPKLHKPMYWEKPQDEDVYQDMLHQEGFLSVKHWTKHNLSRYPMIQQDLKDLEQHLLPVFWTFNQKSIHFQNRYFLYQWVFILGAFLTTFLGILTTYSFTLPESAITVGEVSLTLPDGSAWTLVFTVATTFIAALTTFLGLISDQSKPQTRYARYRRLTEEVRMLYFQFLAHAPPYHEIDRVQKMREKILEIKRQEVDNG